MGVRVAAGKTPDLYESPNPLGGRCVLSDDGELGQAELPSPQFNLLGPTAEDRKRRWLALGLTPLFEAAVIGFTIWALMAFPPQPATEMAREETLYFHLATPAPVKQPPRLLEHPVQAHLAPPPVLPRMRQEKIQKNTVEHLKVPQTSPRAIVLPQAPPKSVTTGTFATAQVHHLVARQEVAAVHMGTFDPASQARSNQEIAMVHTGAFNPGSMAKPTVKRPLRDVETGGFGAANGIPNDPAADGHRKIAMLGSFDLPSGAGYGNGTGGARGVRGTVASSGFGNAVGAASGSRPGSHAPARVHQSNFGSVIVAAQAPRTHSAVQSSAFKPVVILSKPDPVYPPEARRLHIQGQVVLSVLFEASGKLRVLHVVQGLGHGMDAAAIRAAEQIRFKPAEHDGRPIDSAAMVHIIFQLAY